VFSLQGVNHILPHRLLHIALRSAEAMLFLHDMNDLFEWLFVVDPILFDGLLMAFSGGAHGVLFGIYDL
jgi:hypothetical protein